MYKLTKEEGFRYRRYTCEDCGEKFSTAEVRVSYTWGGSDGLAETLKRALGASIREENLEDALLALCQLKEHKDIHGKTALYKMAQPLAWDSAKKLLTNRVSNQES